MNSTQIINAAISKERGELLELLPNEVNEPKYGPKNVVNIVLGWFLIVVVVALVWGVL